MTHVLYELELGSTSDGNHAIESALNCPRRARLDGELKQKWLESGSPLILDDSSYSVGTIFHAYQDLYATGQIHSPKDLDDVEFVCSDRVRQVQIDYEANLEAKRVMSAWMTAFPHDLFGMAVATEYKIPESKAVSKAVGRPKYSGRIDLVTKINQKSAARLADLSERLASHRLELDSGVWILDWKTSAAAYGALGDEYGNSMQIIGYMAAWDVLNPKQKCQGAVIVIAVKTKVPKFIFVRRGPPTKNEIEALKNRHKIEAILKANPVLADMANTARCFPFLMKPCPHWISGACKRY